jgi:hypothetical protein
MKAQIAMPGKPYRSSLIPYEDEIMALRNRKPPMPYAEIAKLLRETRNLVVCRETIFKFIRVRSGGRRVYSYRRKDARNKPASLSRPTLVKARTAEQTERKVEFRFTPSNRYNLTRLPPEEAAAIRKRLEERGH